MTIKRFLTALAIVVLAGPAWAVDTWVTANQATMAWDAVTASEDDTLVESNIEYVVYMDKENKQNPVEAWRGTDTQATVTLTGQGRYVLGVKSVLVVNGVDETESVVVWSDDPLVVAADTFGVLYFKNPKHPVNLRK